MAKSESPGVARTLNLHPSSPDDQSSYPMPSQVLELSISCRGLVTSDSSKPNTAVVLYNLLEPGTQQWAECGRTKEVKNSDSPEFATKFRLEHFFEDSAENVKFVVYNIDPKIPEMSKQEILGEAISAIGDITTAGNRRIVLELKCGTETRGQITIRTEVPDDCKDVVYMSWEGKKCAKGAFARKPNLKLHFSRSNEDRSFSVCLKTDANTTSWNDLEVPVQILCNGDYDRTIKVEIFETSNEEKDISLVGEFATSLRTLKKGPGKDNKYECYVMKKGKREKSAEMRLAIFRIKQNYTFHDYIQSGMEMSFVVAIDFTSSNGNPSEPDSLHHIEPSLPNEYEMAIQGVGYVLQKYDTDKKFPSFGFGARVPPNNKISHRFPLNFSEDPNCNGVSGVLQAYRNCINGLVLDGPTNFAPIIRYVSDEAKKVQGASNYYVLLIITDGVYSDRESTIEAIVEAAKFPMSIIIVGVGKEDFTDMEELDGDDVRLSHRGEEAERDIVQFVPLREHVTKDRSRIISRGRFTNRVLEEIPDQILEYMKKRNLTPGMGAAPPEFPLH